MFYFFGPDMRSTISIACIVTLRVILVIISTIFKALRVGTRIIISYFPTSSLEGRNNK